VAVALVETARKRPKSVSGTTLALGFPPIAVATATSPIIVVGSGVSLWPLFLTFLKIGAVLFGSGYVLIAFLRADFVSRLHWLSESQLLDAVAVGQVTPGPVFTTATFIGYLLAGTKGAVVATVGIFLPSFVFVGLSAPLIPRLRQSRVASAFLDGLNVASLALMAVVTLQLGTVCLSDTMSVLLAALSCVLLFCFQVNSTLLILLGTIVGAASSLLR
jgi:chromate transporter